LDCVVLAAADITKVVMSPALSSAVIPMSESTFEGENSNDSLNGLGFYLGENNIRVTAMVVSASTGSS
jgi:FtsZ-interacting cell division protein ZipA